MFKKKKRYGRKYPTSVTPEGIIRVRTPRKGEILGIVEQSLGSKRFKVRCMDKKVRRCRVPGKVKRRMWVKEGHLVLIKPWEIEGETKGDIIYKYSKTQANWMTRKGYVTEMDEF